MTPASSHAAYVAEPPPGQIEYECRTAIRDLIRLHGFDEARELVAFYLLDEADRRSRTIEHERARA